MNTWYNKKIPLINTLSYFLNQNVNKMTKKQTNKQKKTNKQNKKEKGKKQRVNNKLVLSFLQHV